MTTEYESPEYRKAIEQFELIISEDDPNIGDIRRLAYQRFFIAGWFEGMKQERQKELVTR